VVASGCPDPALRRAAARDRAPRARWSADKTGESVPPFPARRRRATVEELERTLAEVHGYSEAIQFDAAVVALDCFARLGELVAATPKARRPPGPGRGKVGHAAGPTFSSTPTYKA
jgi:hypothetical protein